MYKKKVFVILFTLLIFSAKAQIQLGAHLGVPAFDVAKKSKFILSIDVSYLYKSSTNFKFGPSLSLHYFVNKTGGNQSLYLPLAFASRFSYSKNLFFGADVGYGIALYPKTAESGFYYRPLIGYYLSRGIQVTASVAVINLINTAIVQGNIGIVFSLY